MGAIGEGSGTVKTGQRTVSDVAKDRKPNIFEATYEMVS